MSVKKLFAHQKQIQNLLTERTKFGDFSDSFLEPLESCKKLWLFFVVNVDIQVFDILK